MQAHFGIITGLCFSIAACGNGNEDGLYLTDSSAALGCRDRGTACPDTNGHPSAASPGRANHDEQGAPDAGTRSCHEDEDCAEHDSSGPGSGHDDDDHSADAGPASHEDEDRSGSNSGPH